MRDLIAEALPLKLLCRDDCRGLCAVCGADLNADPEQGTRKRDPRHVWYSPVSDSPEETNHARTEEEDIPASPRPAPVAAEAERR